MKKDKTNRIKTNPNTIIKGERDSSGKISVYLICSGQRNFIFTHRRNNILYGMIGSGISFSELKRWNYHKASSNGIRIRNLKGAMVKQLIKVIEDYIDYELTYDELAV